MPKRYDAADSDAEGVDLEGPLHHKRPISVNKMVPAFTLRQLLQDDFAHAL